MQLNIIHLPHRADRLAVLENELNKECITSYKIWAGIIDEKAACTGISKAHKQIVRYAKETGQEAVLIAEDDIRFTDNGALAFFLSNKPVVYDIYLASIYDGIIRDDNIVTEFAGLTLYIVHQRFYDTFLSVTESKHLDRALAGKGKFVVCQPMAAIQYNGFSDNVKRVCNYDEYLNGRKLFTNE